MSRPGRNERCPCGSGKKFKQCCESKRGGFPSGVIAAVIAAAIIGAIIIGISSARSSAGSGRVWSAEHGHYHDASGRDLPR
jgi:hypothetical protein